MIFAALVLATIAFGSTVPRVNNAGSCAIPVVIAASDSVWWHSRWHGAPIPYRYIVEDSSYTARGDSVSRSYPTNGAIGPFAGKWLVTTWLTRRGVICRPDRGTIINLCRDTCATGCKRSTLAGPR